MHALDAAGVEVIEVTHGDGLGGSSFNYGFSAEDEIKLIAAAVEEATQAPDRGAAGAGIGTMDDLRGARDAGASVARIATHCTEADVSIQHFGAARDLGMETVGFLMMAHRTDAGGTGQAGTDHGRRRRAVRLRAWTRPGALVLGDAQERVARARRGDRRTRPRSASTGTRTCRSAWPTPCWPFQQGARQIDGALCALGAGAGNSPTEVLAATFDRLGIQTGVDVSGVMAAAEDVVRPFLPRWP